MGEQRAGLVLEQLVATMIPGRDQAYLNRPWVAARTIHVGASPVGLLDFAVTRGRRHHRPGTGGSPP